MPPIAQPVALRVELLDISPLIWRRILVSNHWTLASLHHYLQWVMGWHDSHAHEFRVGQQCVGPDWWIREIESDQDAASYKDERRVSIAAVLREVGIGGEIEYHYDMGDDWIHRIVFEPMPPVPLLYEMRLPVCIAGENACPPEDVGGPHAYAQFVECIADHHHPEHVDMLRWVGGTFDPKGFDLNRLNRDWALAGSGARRSGDTPNASRPLLGDLLPGT